MTEQPINLKAEQSFIISPGPIVPNGGSFTKGKPSGGAEVVPIVPSGARAKKPGKDRSPVAELLRFAGGRGLTVEGIARVLKLDVVAVARDLGEMAAHGKAEQTDAGWIRIGVKYDYDQTPPGERSGSDLDDGIRRYRLGEQILDALDDPGGTPKTELTIGLKIAEGQLYVKREFKVLDALGSIIRQDDRGWTRAKARSEPNGEAKGRKPLIVPRPFVWRDPQEIPPRQWVYGNHYIRKFLTATIAIGGLGKSSLDLVEAIVIATGLPLLGIEPKIRTKVWYWNGEDPQEELDRRVAAVCQHYEIERSQLEDRLFVGTGREDPIKLAGTERNGLHINVELAQDIGAGIRDNDIGVFIADPFVTIHSVSENDNTAMDVVSKICAEIADAANCSFETCHHVRKTNGAEVTIDDARGASSIANKARVARVLNLMSEDDAARAGVASTDRGFYFRSGFGKDNLNPKLGNVRWYRFASEDLRNPDEVQDSDKVGVVTRWEMPGILASLTEDHLKQVQARLEREGQLRLDEKADTWIGHLVAEVLGVDIGHGGTRTGLKPEQKGKRDMVIATVEAWLKGGELVKVNGKDKNRNTRTFVRSARGAASVDES